VTGDANEEIHELAAMTELANADDRGARQSPGGHPGPPEVPPESREGHKDARRGTYGATPATEAGAMPADKPTH
jgi:hypothetical protein